MAKAMNKRKPEGGGAGGGIGGARVTGSPYGGGRPPAWYAKPGGKIRGQGDLSTAAGRAKTAPKNESKLESRRMPLEKALAKRGRGSSQILPNSVSRGKPSVPAKIKTSPKKRGK